MHRTPDASEPLAQDLREALEQALDAEGDRLYALALRITRDPALADDAVQEAFATALERSASFRGEARVSTWLYRIVYSKSVDLLRKRGREAPLDDDANELSASTASDFHRSPDERVAEREVHEALEAAAVKLTPAQRAVFELKMIEGRSTDEVARLLEMPPGTVRVHLHRARLKLREELSGLLSGAKP